MSWFDQKFAKILSFSVLSKNTRNANKFRQKNLKSGDPNLQFYVCTIENYDLKNHLKLLSHEGLNVQGHFKNKNNKLTKLVVRLFPVHQTSSWGQMIGFVHAEDHYWSGTEFSTVSSKSHWLENNPSSRSFFYINWMTEWNEWTNLLLLFFTLGPTMLAREKKIKVRD
jgi:hypothetical protein